MFTLKTMLIIRIILGVIILSSSVLTIFIPLNSGLFILIVAALELLALSMNFKYESDGNNGWKISERNSWDVWFFSMPAVILTLFFIGILADDIEVWKWVAISLGGTAGVESLSAIIKNFRR